ncbi:hypothetical protein Barb4_04734 [Bacteroidales bacterium Barb4]|nr:hypothetical protein Barb4_04734 [Bacteroidales bacterium Barb4]
MGYFFQTASLCTHTGDKQKMPRRILPHIQQHLPLRGTDHIHYPLLIRPFLRLLQYLFKQTLAAGILRKLKILRAFVGSKSQQNHPAVGINKERLHAVFTHIGGDGDGIRLVCTAEESAGVHLRRIADVTALGIGNNKLIGIVFANICHCLLKGKQTLYAQTLVESHVWLESYTIIGCCINDSLVESENRVFLVQQVWGYLCDIGVQSYAEEGTLPLYILE